MGYSDEQCEVCFVDSAIVSVLIVHDI
jgi:hypothetical protein